MHPPELIERGGRQAEPARRPSRWERLRPGRSLFGFPLAVGGAWALLVAGFAGVGQLFGPEEDRGTWGGVIGAAVGNFLVVFVLALVVSAIARLTSGKGARAPVADAESSPPPSPPANAAPAEPPGAPDHERAVRRVVLGGVLGGLPGLLIVGVPLLLQGLGIISADQSQIGFIGVPLLLIGAFAGVLTAADAGQGGHVAFGAAVGFVGGLAIGAAATTVLLAAGIGLPGAWLLTAAAGTIAGAAFSVRRQL